jgi:DNA-binding PadR family transcriptional regulator
VPEIKPLRWSPHTEALLSELLQTTREWRHGYDLLKSIGLGAGTVYPILARLAARGWLDTTWDDAQATGPRRHLYRLTPLGRREAKALSARGRARNRPARFAIGDA